MKPTSMLVVISVLFVGSFILEARGQTDPRSTAGSQNDGAFDQQLSGLTGGDIAVEIPQGMAVGEVAVVVCRLSTKVDAGDLRTSTNQGLVGKIMLGRVVRVSLIAPDFNITSEGVEEQAISSESTNEWRWHISPRKPGLQEVRILVTTTVDVGGTQKQLTIRAFNQSIAVQNTWFFKLSGTTPALFVGIIFVSLLALFYMVRPSRNLGLKVIGKLSSLIVENVANVEVKEAPKEDVK